MWEHYRKTAKLMQLIILVTCLVFYVFFSANIFGIIALIVVMEFFAVVGAWWGVRMRRKFSRGQEILPLERPSRRAT